MVSTKRSPFMYGVVGLVVVTLIFHLVGFVTPGWLVLKRTITEPSRHIGGHFIQDDIFSRGQLNEINDGEAFNRQMFEKRETRSVESLDSDEETEDAELSHERPSHDGPHHDRPHGDRPHGGRPHGRPHSESHSGSGHHERPGRPHHPNNHHNDHFKSMDSEFSKNFHNNPEHQKSNEHEKELCPSKDELTNWLRMKKFVIQGYSPCWRSYWKIKVKRSDFCFRSCRHLSQEEVADVSLTEGEVMPLKLVDDVTILNEILGNASSFTAVDDMQGAEIQTHFGLWYSKVCVRPITGKKASGESKDEDGNKGHCKKISTYCALHYSFIYEAPDHFKKNVRTLDHKQIAFASLAEHRAETCVSLVFIVLGLVATVWGYRDIQRYRGVVCASIVFMVIAALTLTVPVARFARYNVHKDNEKFPVYVHIPYSIISGGISAFLAFCVALITTAVLCMNVRKTKEGNWQKFENDQPEPEKKNENLVFYNDQLPVKSGLYDVCDFSDIKPVEEKTMKLEADI